MHEADEADAAPGEGGRVSPRPRVEPGVDGLAPVTAEQIARAKEIVGRSPVFWGRSFASPDRAEGAYQPATESPLLSAEDIRVLPIARQARSVGGSREQGLRDARDNVADLLRCFGEDDLAAQGGQIYLFLDVEADPRQGSPSLSAAYFMGWASGLRGASAKVTVHPCVRARWTDDDTPIALRAAAAQGVTCRGLWVVRPCHDASSKVRPWDDVIARPKSPVPGCKVLIWQHHPDGDGEAFGRDEINPSIDLEDDLRRFLVRPTPASTTAPQPPENLPRPAGSRRQALIVLGALALMVAAGFIPRLPGGLLWGIEAGAMIAVFAAIGKSVAGRPAGLLVSPQKLLSLSRFQTVLWTVLLLSAYVTIVLRRMGQPDPPAVAIAPHLWALMGISTTSLVGTPLLQILKRRRTPEGGLIEEVARAFGEAPAEVAQHASGLLYGNAKIEDAAITDLFSGDEVGNAHLVDLGKVQMFVLTLVAAAAYAASLFKLINGADPAVITSFPEMGTGMLALLAVSHAGYLASKAAPHTAVSTTANSGVKGTS